jgi:hypothetical protein
VWSIICITRKGLSFLNSLPEDVLNNVGSWYSISDRALYIIEYLGDGMLTREELRTLSGFTIPEIYCGLRALKYRDYIIELEED